MAWETRKRGGRYYCRSVWKNGRVSREYIGCGILARAQASLDEMDRQQKERQREADRLERERLDRLERQIVELCEEADRAMKEALEAAGYHLHSRGEWRRRRAKDSKGAEGSEPADKACERTDAAGAKGVV